VSTGLCRAPICPEESSSVEALPSRDLNWSFSGACFFCFTVITTIGYGNYVPATPEGKTFTIFFATVGFVLYAFTMNNFKV
jgi:potassium channel subfamily K protein 16